MKWCNELRAQPCILGFEDRNPLIEALYGSGHILRIETLWNVLTAILSPRVDLDQDRALDAGAVRRIGEFYDQLTVVRHNPCAAPHSFTRV